MNAINFQTCLRLAIIPHIREKYPYGHRILMDNTPSHPARSSRRFILLNNLNHFPSPPESPNLTNLTMPVEMAFIFLF